MNTKDPFGLKGIAEAYSGDARKSRVVAGTKANDIFLVESYTARRRRIDPAYRPSRTDAGNLARLRKRLEFRKVPRTRWGSYLDWLFERFPIITHGRVSWPPTKTAAAESLVESWLAECGPRSMNVNRAKRMLRGAGFKDVDLDVVVASAQRAASKGRTKPGAGLDDQTTAAVTWLIPRLGEVGYED